MNSKSTLVSAWSLVSGSNLSSLFDSGFDLQLAAGELELLDDVGGPGEEQAPAILNQRKLDGSEMALSAARLGTPDGLYNEPETAFVASFIGENNLLDGVVERVDGKNCLIALPTGLKVNAVSIGGISTNASVQLAVRPERISLASRDGKPANQLQATIEGRIYLGDHLRLLTPLANGQPLTVKVGAQEALTNGETIDLCWSVEDCRAFASTSTTQRDGSKPGRG